MSLSSADAAPEDAAGVTRRCRVGVFSDLLYRCDSDGLSSHQAFVRFVTSLPPRVDEVVLFGRVKPTPERTHYALPTVGVRFVELPHYPRVTSVGGQLRAYRQARQRFVQELDNLDLVWIFGPHPLAVGACLLGAGWLLLWRCSGARGSA